MASTEQSNLSDFIKSVHKKLREEAKVLGTEEAWKNHCKNEENLKKYAKSMQELAVNHWDKNSIKYSKVVSRVSWVYEACKEYYQNIHRFRDKELNIMKNHLNFSENNILDFLNSLRTRAEEKYKLLDVGSCYNPFKVFSFFDVLPIDIAPANNEVFKCDFLNLELSDKLLFRNETILQLPEGYFDIIVFSLLLEYLPSPEQRLKCCLNAYKLLKPEGLLVIITPDSNHVGSNAKIMKSWRYILAKHGFNRVQYEKLPFLHCMLFRKALLKDVTQRWAELFDNAGLLEQIYIPQDFQCNIKDNGLENQENLGNHIEWSNDTFLNSFDLD